MASAEVIENRLRILLNGFSRNRRYLAGVSGGCDSVVLLHLLHRLGFRKLVVCHLNHGLRGAASGHDARFTRRIGERLGYEVLVERSDIRALAARGKISEEAAARDARIEFFQRVGRERRIDTVFLAHHADDQVETFLFNLLRGAGAAGLGGMRFSGGHGSVTVVRPLLEFWREDLRAYAAEQGIAFREDASNATGEYTRNRLRLEGIPGLANAMGRDPRLALWRTAAILRSENDFLQSQVPVLADEPRVRDLMALAEPLLRRALLDWLRRRGVPRVGFEEIERVRQLLDARNGPAKVNLPGGKFARRRKGVMFVQ